MRKYPIVTAPMPEDLQGELRKLVDAYGVAQTCNLLHLSRSSVVQALSGMRVRRSTITQVRVGLKQIAVGEVELPVPQPPSATVMAFVLEHCELSPVRSVESGALYEAWRGWCERKRRPPDAQNIFGRMLFDALPELRVSRPRIGTKRLRMYEGIGLVA